MGADSDELPTSADILVQLVLQINERLVGAFGELDIAQDSAAKELSYLFCLRHSNLSSRSAG